MIKIGDELSEFGQGGLAALIFVFIEEGE